MKLSAPKIMLATALIACSSALAPKASAQATTPTAKEALKHAFSFVGFDTTGIKFDLPSDPEYNADNSNYAYHLTINSQSNGSVVGFSNDLNVIKKLANAAILLYEVGQVRNVSQGATASNP